MRAGAWRTATLPVPMKRSPLALAVLCLALAAPAWAGAQDPPRIAAGLSVAGVDVSGLTVAEATARLNEQLAPRLAGDLLLGAAGRPWTLTMKAAGLRLDAERSAKRALYAPAGTVTVAPAIVHSRVAVRTFVEGVAGRVDHPARDARVKITLRHIFRQGSRPGRALDVTAARAAIDAALDDPAAPRVLHQVLRVVKAKVTTADLPRVYGTVITVDRAHFKLRLFKRLKFSRAYSVAVGQPAYPTPTGRFRVQSKQINPVWSVPNSPWAGELAGTTVQGGTAANPLKARWMGLADGVGIHGTGEDWSIGSRASHGCIRMHVADVIDLYRRVPVGTSVLIS
jgi:hypothetical protein